MCVCVLFVPFERKDLLIPFGFGQENGIIEKNPTFNKILLLGGLFSGFKTIKSLSSNTGWGRK